MHEFYFFPWIPLALSSVSFPRNKQLNNTVQGPSKTSIKALAQGQHCCPQGNICYTLKSVQFTSAQSLSLVWCFVTPMDWRTPSLPVHHQFSKPTQIHVSDAIQPSHPLSSLSPLTFNLSKHQGLFQWVSSSLQVAKVLEFQLQHQSFQWTPRTDLLQDRLVVSPCSPRDSQESSLTPQLKSINSSVVSFLYSPNSHIHTWPLEKP